jgi:hypothetical protein
MAWLIMLSLLAQSTTSPDRQGGDVVEKDPSLTVGASKAGSSPHATASAELDLRPNVGPEQLPPVTTWRAYASFALIAGQIVVVVWLLTIWLHRPRQVRLPPPDQAALAELDRLDKQPPVSNDDVRRYCTQISSILRQYLESRFGFRAVEQTTPEFVATLQESSPLTPAQKESVVGLLMQTDLVKFAAMVPTTPECAGLMTGVRDFIRESAALKTPPPRES